MMRVYEPSDRPPLVCDRCSTTLAPGRGTFYVVKVEAYADPTPPIIQEDDLSRDVGEEIERLIARMWSMTEQEAMDQVYRRLTLYLCGPCYRQWIEDPTGRR